MGVWEERERGGGTDRGGKSVERRRAELVSRWNGTSGSICGGPSDLPLSSNYPRGCTLEEEETGSFVTLEVELDLTAPLSFRPFF